MHRTGCEWVVADRAAGSGSSSRDLDSKVGDKLEVPCPDVEHARLRAGREGRNPATDAQRGRLDQPFLGRRDEAMAAKGPIVRIPRFNLDSANLRFADPYSSPDRRSKGQIRAIAARVGRELESRDDVVGSAERSQALVFRGRGKMTVGLFPSLHIDRAVRRKALADEPQ